MNANELMTREPRSVRTTDRLDAAARVMWEQDCGIVPVVDAANVLVGVVTDRDLCMASYTQGRALGEIAVATSMARQLRTCRPEDPVATVLATMQQAQVHRLPVVDARGVLLGIVSINDIVRTAHSRPATIEAAGVVKTLATIAAPRRALAVEQRRVPAAAAPAQVVASGAQSAAAAAPLPTAAKPPTVLPAAPAVTTRGAGPVAVPAKARDAKARDGGKGKDKQS